MIEIRRFESAEAARSAIVKQRMIDDVPLPEAVQARIAEVFGERIGVEEVARRIIADVAARGDVALRHYSQVIDGVELSDLIVPPERLAIAWDAIDASLRNALQVAADRLRDFHERARRNSWLDYRGDGALGQIIRPLQRVGIYAPGGRAPYPSSVLMAAIPARVAGVEEIVVASPPGPNGEISEVLLAAAYLAGAHSVYRLGGAQAIAALALGTNSVERVDKIVGPGNLFVVAAKRLVNGFVGIDGLPGPTECVLIADEHANVEYLASDLLAQAEHDPMAQPVLLATSAQVIDDVLAAAQRQLEQAPRAQIMRESLAARGMTVVTSSIEEAMELANMYAPEHMAICTRDPWRWLPSVRNAGGVFVGELAAESIGDYSAGPSHIMPTGGTARFASPVSLDDFVKITSVFAMGESDVKRLGPPAMDLARAEGLHGHAYAIELRLKDLQ
ncbi:MAG: histidinol dehydrogenase [Chloroflexota bacterium]